MTRHDAGAPGVGFEPNAPPPEPGGRSAELLSVNREWFEIWLAAFGGARSGIWPPGAGAGDLAIPYTLGERRIGRVRVPVAFGAANAHTPRYDVLGPVSTPDVLSGMMADLGVDMLVFPYLPSASRLLRALRGPGATLSRQIEFCETSPYVDCRGAWDDYWQTRGKTTREGWAKQERKLLKRGAQFVLLRQWHEVEAVLPTVLAIEASGWKGEQGSAIRQHDNTLKFYTALTRAWAQRGELYLFLLSMDGVHVAFQLCALCDGVLSSLKVGFLHDYVKDSPGQVLRLHALRWAFAQPNVSRLDMLGPRTDHKVKWATAGEDLYTLRVFRRSARGRLAWLRFVWGPRIKAAFDTYGRRTDRSARPISAAP